jgi:hypothetical protein
MVFRMTPPIAIVLADRSNMARRSDILPRVAARFGDCGQPVFLFQSPRQAASERINRRLEQVLPGIARSTGQALSWPGRLCLVRGQTVLACASPQRWDFLVAALLPPWRSLRGNWRSSSTGCRTSES